MTIKRCDMFYQLNEINEKAKAFEFYTILVTTIMTCFNYDNQRVSLDKYVIIKEDETIKKEFHDAGLKITECYSDVSGKKYENDTEIMALIAKKI